MWNKEGRLIAALARDKHWDLPRTIDFYYRSEFVKMLHDERTGLYLYGDLNLLSRLKEEIK